MISVLAIVMGSLFLAAYSLALGDPVPRRIDAAFVSQWLPSGATVTAMRDAVYFRSHQHARPIFVLVAWATLLFASMVVISHRRRTSPGGP